MSATIALRFASPSDRDDIVAILCDAFQDDSIHRWVFRNRRSQDYWLSKTMRETVRFTFSHGVAIVANADDCPEPVGAALWYPPPERLSFWWETNELAWWDTIGAQLRFAPLLFDWPAYRRHFVMNRFLNSIAPAQVGRCWFLNALAVRKSHNRRGIGSTLLREGLARASSQQLPVFLRAWAHLVPFYERYGFASVTQATLPGGEQVCHGLVWYPPRRAEEAKPSVAQAAASPCLPVRKLRAGTD